MYCEQTVQDEHLVATEVKYISWDRRGHVTTFDPFVYTLGGQTGWNSFFAGRGRTGVGWQDLSRFVQMRPCIVLNETD